MYLGVSSDIFLLFNWIYVVMAAPCVVQRGTTRHIKDVFIGRCWQYQNALKDEDKVNINCTELWNAFKEGFAYKDPSSSSSATYTKFFSLLRAESDRKLNNTMFYSGSKDLVDDFVHINDDYVVLEETLTGHVLDGLHWCGSSTSPDGLNYTLCPKWEEPCDVMQYVWQIASRKFARRAIGKAHTLLNASRSNNGTAYDENGFFRQYEMPVLTVDHLVVYVASNIRNPSREKCGTGSLLVLEHDAARRNITVTCIDQPELVLRIFCIKNRKSSHCIKKHNRYNRYEVKPRKWRILGITFSVISVVLLLGVAVAIVRQCISRKGENYSIQQEEVQNSKLNNHVKDSTGPSSGCQSNGILLA